MELPSVTCENRYVTPSSLYNAWMQRVISNRSIRSSLGEDVSCDALPFSEIASPNVANSEPAQHFKNTGLRFYAHDGESNQLSFRSQASPYGGFTGSSLGNIASQPRSSMYPSFDNQMFGNVNGTDTSTGSFNQPNARRMGFGGFPMDSNSFGYNNDQRDNGNVRDPSFTDPSFPNNSRLFEM